MVTAARLDAMRKKGTVIGPLHGIPIIVEDNIATAMTNSSSMNTTAGSYALLGSVPPTDSTVAAKLKRQEQLFSERQIYPSGQTIARTIGISQMNSLT